MGLEVFEVINSLAKKCAEAQENNPFDYIGDDGLKYCCYCHTQKEVEIEFSINEKPYKQKVACLCRCAEEKLKADNLEREKKEKQQETERRMSYLSCLDILRGRFDDIFLDDIEIDKFNERNMKLCRRYVTGFDEMIKNNQCLIMWGNVGRGKTLAAAAIANELKRKGYSVVVTSSSKIVEAIQSDAFTETELMSNLRYAQLLVIDDVGAERSTEYAIEKINTVIDGRYRQKLPMIVTTNYSIADMKNEDDIRYARIFDRLIEDCFPMQFTGSSWRKKKAKQRFDDFLTEQEKS